MTGLTQNVEEESSSHVQQMECNKKESENEANVLSLGCRGRQQKIWEEMWTSQLKLIAEPKSEHAA